MSLFVVGVDALTDGDQPDSGKVYLDAERSEIRSLFYIANRSNDLIAGTCSNNPLMTS